MEQGGVELAVMMTVISTGRGMFFREQGCSYVIKLSVVHR